MNFSVTDAAHPIAADVDNFTSRDEHYLVDVTAPDAQVFFTSQSEKGGVQPAGYTRLMGKGRLCALTPGHTLAVWMASAVPAPVAGGHCLVPEGG